MPLRPRKNDIWPDGRHGASDDPSTFAHDHLARTAGPAGNVSHLPLFVGYVTSYGFVSTYPPTVCGLATFTASLRGALVRDRDDVGDVVQVVESPGIASSDGVVAQLAPDDPHALERAAARLNRCDVVVLQHEYGIYGGRDGEEVIGLLDRLRVPSIVVLHTVLRHPSDHQRAVLEAVLARADRIVVMTRAAYEPLLAGYSVRADKVHIIPHGAPDMGGAQQPDGTREDRFVALTWGLLGPGKGIEWAIEAMALVRAETRSTEYIVAGRTHPRVLELNGEAYRDSLAARVKRLGLETTVRFDPRYRDAASLAELVRSADAVILPYDSTDQVTSGVLTEAVAAGKPVIATKFPHAREQLADGCGILVEHGDPAGIAEALRTLLADVAAGARRSASPRNLLWPAVAHEYRRLADELLPVAVGA